MYQKSPLAPLEVKSFVVLYLTLSQKYAVTWNALNVLANSNKNIAKFPPLKRNKNMNDLVDLTNAASNTPNSGFSKKDGFNTIVDSTLATKLQIVLK